MYKICENQKYDKQILDSVSSLVNDVLRYENNFLERTFNYMNNYELEYYPNMKVELNEKELLYKIDILEELVDYLKGKEFDNKSVIIKKLNQIDKTNILTYEDKEFIIQYIENNPATENFLEYIKNKYKVLPELEMMYERYSSILHLIIISHTITKYYELSFSYVSDKIELSNNNKIILYCSDNTNLTSKSKWIKQLILRYCYFNYILETEKCPKVLSIFMVDFPKMLYNSGIIGPAEINTGMTNGIYINITRKEEALKTLLHELIHFHNMDFRNIPTKLNKLLVNNFSQVTDEGYNMKLNLFEAYTECIASILNICLFYYYNHNVLNNKNFNLYINNLILILSKQITYTFGKCYSLKKYFKCDKDNVVKCKINQKTNTVSYFFIKSYIYFYMPTFFKCIDICSLKFIYCDESFNHLYRMIKNGITDPNLDLIYKNCYIDNKIKKRKGLNINSNSIKMVCITENIF